MSGGNNYYRVYWDSQRRVHVKMDFYKLDHLAESTKRILSTLEVVEQRLTECTCSTQEDQGNRHCVRYTYPHALTWTHYRRLLKGIE